MLVLQLRRLAAHPIATSPPPISNREAASGVPAGTVPPGRPSVACAPFVLAAVALAMRAPGALSMAGPVRRALRIEPARLLRGH